MIPDLSGYRTLLVSILVAVIGATCAHYGWGVQPDDRYALAFALVSLLFAFMRHITTGPAGWRKGVVSFLDDPEVQALIAEIEKRFEPKLVAAHPSDFVVLTHGGQISGSTPPEPLPPVLPPPVVP